MCQSQPYAATATRSMPAAPNTQKAGPIVAVSIRSAPDRAKSNMARVKAKQTVAKIGTDVNTTVRRRNGRRQMPTKKSDSSAE